MAAKPTRKPTTMRDIGEALVVIQRDVGDMKPDVRDTKECVTILSTQMTFMQNEVADAKKRITDVEKIGHNCEQEETMAALQSKVDTDVQEGIKTRERLSAADRRVQVIEAAEERNSAFRRSTALWIIGVIIMVLGSAGTGIWVFGGSSREAEIIHRTTADKAAGNTKRITAIEVKLHKNHEELVREIRSIPDGLPAGKGELSFNEWYRSLTPRDRARLGRSVKKLPTTEVVSTQ